MKHHLPIAHNDAAAWAPAHVRDVAPGSIKVYQIETTNWCNATCTYCPQPTHVRPRGFLSEETLSQALTAMSNKSVSLHHFGEPLLHKGLERLVRLASRRGFEVGLSTNGKGLTQTRLNALSSAGLAWMRLHTDPFGVRLSKFSVPAGLEMTEHRILVASDAPKKEMVSFSGHLDLAQKGGSSRCSYLSDRWAVVLWDGRVALCCHDVEGTRSADLCTKCDGYVFKSPRDWGDYDGGGSA